MNSLTFSLARFCATHREFFWGVLAGSLLELAHVAWLYYRKTHPPIRLSDCSVLEYISLPGKGNRRKEKTR